MLALSGKMDIFDSLINTLSTISTSGIMAQAPGLSFYQSFYVEIVITVFTILAAMNFNMYFLLLNRRFGDFFKNVELRAFFWIIAVTTVLISLNLTFSGFYGNITESLRYAFTQVVSFYINFRLYICRFHVVACNVKNASLHTDVHRRLLCLNRRRY